MGKHREDEARLFLEMRSDRVAGKRLQQGGFLIAKITEAGRGYPRDAEKSVFF